MSVTKGHVYGALAAAALAAAYFSFATVWPRTLQFRDRAFPAGFREFVLRPTSSALDPFAGLQPAPAAGAAAQFSTREVCDALFRDPDSPAVGNRESPVQIAAFLDYRCPYCKTLTGILSKVQAGDVRVVYKEWPVLGDNSVLGARAGLAADKQGQYLAFHTRLMNSRFIPTTAYVEDVAADLGMSLTQLRKDMGADATTRAIQRTSELAGALRLIGTPVLVVGRTIVQGEVTRAQLDRLIENEMRPAPKVC